MIPGYAILAEEIKSLVSLFRRKPKVDRTELHRAYLRLHHFGIPSADLAECDGDDAPVANMSWPSVIRLAARGSSMYGDA